MPKPRQPADLKLLTGRGNGKDIAGRPIPAVPPFEKGAPVAPDWLDPEARRVWDETLPSLESLNLIKPEDGPVFAALCTTWSTYVAAQRRIQLEGLTLTNPSTGHVGTNPVVTVAANAGRDLVKLATHFGLTPLSETGLGKPAVTEPETDNPFAEAGASA